MWLIGPLRRSDVLGACCRRRMGILASCLLAILTVLVLINCADSRDPDFTPRNRTVTWQPVLRPRAAVTTTAAPAQTKSTTAMAMPMPDEGPSPQADSSTATPTPAPTEAPPSRLAPERTTATPEAPPATSLQVATPTVTATAVQVQAASTAAIETSKPEESSQAQGPALLSTPSARPDVTVTPAIGATRESTQPVEALPELMSVVQVAAGENHACALLQDGHVVCWGANDQGQLNAPVDVTFTQITSGWRYSCGLRTDGGITCWGRNNHMQASAPTGQFTAVDAGWDHTCAISYGVATCWGWTANRRTEAPTTILFSNVQAGAEHSCGLTDERDLFCWGENQDGRADSRKGPFYAMAVGLSHTCVLRRDGTALCQGASNGGQTSPPDTEFAQLSAGLDHTCGVTRSGFAECWGDVQARSAGLPKAVPTARLKSISSGWHGRCAVAGEGLAQCWGYTLSGALISPYFASERSQTFLRTSLARPFHRLQFIDVLSGHVLEQPTDSFPWPYGGTAVADKRGLVRLYADGVSPKVILDISSDVHFDGVEGGLLSATLDPSFENHPYLYLYYTMREANHEERTRARLSRFPIDDELPLRDQELVILEIVRQDDAQVHYGGTARFGPDGMLYLGVGDARCYACPQQLNELHGKIIRIDVRGASTERPYTVPEDNPFLERADALPEIWAYGLRNPWRMAFDEEDGTLWVGDVGRATQEEISIVSKGSNLGWPILEGSDCFAIPNDESDEVRAQLSGYNCGDLEGIEYPLISYGRQWGCPGDTTCSQPLGYHPIDFYGTPPRCAVVGGFVYRGSSIPWLRGSYLFGDFCSGEVWALEGDASEGWRIIQIADLPRVLSSFSTDASGEVIVLTFGGAALRLVDVAREPGQ